MAVGTSSLSDCILPETISLTTIITPPGFTACWSPALDNLNNCLTSVKRTPIKHTVSGEVTASQFVTRNKFRNFFHLSHFNIIANSSSKYSSHVNYQVMKFCCCPKINYTSEFHSFQTNTLCTK